MRGIVEVTFTIATQGDPNSQHIFFDGAVDDGRSTPTNQFISEDGRRRDGLAL